MKTMLQKLALVALTLTAGLAFCPNVGDAAQPKGTRRSGADAYYKRTPPFGGALVVFTPQEAHECIKDATDIITERLGAGRPEMRHSRCTACNTYNIFGECGYTLEEDQD